MSRRSKRLKLLHEQSASPTSVRKLNVHEEEPIVGLDSDPEDGLELCGSWLPDGVCFHIYSYVSNGHIIANRYADGVASLVHSTRMVSQDVLKSVQRYLRQAPLKMLLRYGDDATQTQRRINWACRNRVHLDELFFDVPHLNTKGLERVVDFKRILHTCQTTKLQKFGLILPMYNNLCHTFETLPDSPGREFQNFVLMNTPGGSGTDINISGVKKLSLAFHTQEFFLPLLKRYSNSLEELEIRICRHAKNRPDELVLEDLSKVIQGMTHLKKLKICNYGKFGAASIQIMSTSLEEIDTGNCDNGFFVETCECPSLKSFRFMHREQSKTHVERKNGLKLRVDEWRSKDTSIVGKIAMDEINTTLGSCKNLFGFRFSKGIHLPQTVRVNTHYT